MKLFYPEIFEKFVCTGTYTLWRSQLYYYSRQKENCQYALQNKLAGNPAKSARVCPPPSCQMHNGAL